MSRIPNDFNIYARQHTTKNGPVTTWWVSYTLGPGERYRKPLGIKGDDKTAERKALRKAQDLFRSGEFSKSAPTSSQIFAKYAEGFFTKLSTDLTPNYRKAQQGLLDRYATPKLGHLRLNQLSVKVLEEWAAGLPQTPVAVRAWIALNGLLEEAVRLEDLDENRLKRVRADKPQNQRRSMMTREEGIALLSRPDLFEHETAYLVSLTAALAAPRESELVALKPEDIGDGVIRVRAMVRTGVGYVDQDTKTGASGIHDCGVPTWLTDRLKAFSKGQQWVFPGRSKDSPVNPITCLRWLQAAMDRAKIDHKGRRIVFHGWRQWCASTLSGAGASPTAIDFHLGHSITGSAGVNSGTLGIYLRQTDEHVREIREAWVRVIPSSPDKKG